MPCCGVLAPVRVASHVGRHQGLLLSGSADRTVKVYKPYPGRLLEVDKERRARAAVDHQACWGGANLPLRIATSGQHVTRLHQPSPPHSWQPVQHAPAGAQAGGGFKRVMVCAAQCCSNP